MTSSTIYIVCTIEASYAQHFAVMCVSLFENNPKSKFRIYLIHDNLLLNDHEKINQLFKKYNQEIECLKIDSSQFEGYPLSAHAKNANYFRILLPDILPRSIDQILYLDCDIIVRGTVKELWELDLKDYAVAAYGNTNENVARRLGLKNKKYFNSGVMLVNLDYWRKNSVSSLLVNFINQNLQIIEFWDQDALNAVLKDKWIEFCEMYNYIIDVQPMAVSPVIVHFVGTHKPWHPHCVHFYKEEYFKYLKLTPWKDFKLKERSIWHLFKQGIKLILNRTKLFSFNVYLQK